MAIVEDRVVQIASGAGAPRAGERGRARRGRPLLMSRERVLERIQALARSENGLFRVHREHPSFYARARRLFGSWSAAVTAAGVDYGSAVGAARARSLHSRRARTRRRRPASR